MNIDDAIKSAILWLAERRQKHDYVQFTAANLEEHLESAGFAWTCTQAVLSDLKNLALIRDVKHHYRLHRPGLWTEVLTGRTIRSDTNPIISSLARTWGYEGLPSLWEKAKQLAASSGQQVAAGYLGLVVDRDERRVSRDGCQPVDLTDKEWSLFWPMFKAGEAGLSARDAKRAYSGEASAIGMAVTRLREKLQPLGITIEPRAWRLIDDPGM